MKAAQREKIEKNAQETALATQAWIIACQVACEARLPWFGLLPCRKRLGLAFPGSDY